MSNQYLFALLLGSCIFGSLGEESKDCGLSEILELASCSENHTSFLSDLGGHNESGLAVMEAMCSDTGRVVLGCFFDVIAKCPTLINSTDGSDMSSVLPFDITDEGGMDKFCDDIKGCDEMIKCIDEVSTNEPDIEPDLNFTQYMTNAAAFNEAKAYLFFQQLASMVCGPNKPMLECMMTKDQCSYMKDQYSKHHGYPDSRCTNLPNKPMLECMMTKDQCSYMKDQYSKQMDIMMKQAAAGIQNVKYMTFDEMMDFVISMCPNIPQGFGSSECLQKQLMSSGFSTCHQNFTATYKTRSERQTCKAHAALEDCFTNNVEPECGAAMSDFMVKNTHLMVDGISRDCVPVDSGTSKPLVTSTMILMAALFVAKATLI